MDVGFVTRRRNFAAILQRVIARKKSEVRKGKYKESIALKQKNTCIGCFFMGIFIFFGYSTFCFNFSDILFSNIMKGEKNGQIYRNQEYRNQEII